MDHSTAPKAKTKAAPKPLSKPPNKAASSVPDTLVAARSIGLPGAGLPVPPQISSLPAKPVSSLPAKPVSSFPAKPFGLVPARKPASSQPPTLPTAPVTLPKSNGEQSRNEVNSGRTLVQSEPSAGKPHQNPLRPTQPVKRPKQQPNLFIPKKVRSGRTPSSLVHSTLKFVASCQRRRCWRAAQQKARLTPRHIRMNTSFGFIHGYLGLERGKGADPPVLPRSGT